MELVLNKIKYRGLHKSNHVDVFSVGLNCIQIDLDFLKKQVSTKYQVKLSATTEYLHGAGPSFTTSYNLATGVPLQVIGTLQSRAYVVGKMIKSDFSNSFSCNFNFNANGTAHWRVQQLACTYTS
jgi:hypothetical protein